MNISHIRHCYGCGLCATVCSKNIIKIELDKDGFYAPILKNPDKCTDCNVCADVCSFLDSNLSLNKLDIHSYAAWSNNKQVRRKCSSGGIGFEIGKQLIEQGYKACSVRYNVNQERAEHYIATTVEEYIPSIGSKYIQSYTPDGFKSVNRKDKHLITGTPCQIDSFRRYIKRFKIEENFVLLDFFCHSVPSIWVWKKYLQTVEKTTGKITYASWRNKFTGWHDSWAMSIDGEKTDKKQSWNNSYHDLIKERKGTYNSRLSQGDIFYKLFLGDYCCNPACQEKCKYKYDKSSADIRIGDLWGSTYNNNEEGVSALISFTSKGHEIIRGLKECTMIEHPFKVVAEGQMKHNVKKSSISGIMMPLLYSSNKLSIIVIKFIFIIDFLFKIPKRAFNKILRTIKQY